MNEYLDLCGISQHTRDISRNRNKPLTHNKSRRIPKHNTLGDLLGLTREEQKNMVNKQKAMSKAKVIMEE